jgi:hypothetical protein
MNGGITLRRSVTPAFRLRASTIRGSLIRGALPALAGALVLAGCGGNAADASAAGTSASATAPAGLSALETCLKQHGVTVKPGQFSARPHASFSPGAFPTGSPRPRASFAGRNSAAFKACAKDVPSGFGGGFNRVISSSALAAFKSCLSANGVKVTGSTPIAILSETALAKPRPQSAPAGSSSSQPPPPPAPNGDLQPRLPSGSARVVSRRARRPSDPRRWRGGGLARAAR